MDPEFSIVVKNVSKSYKIYHEKRNTLFEYFTSFFSKKNSIEKLDVLKDISFNVKKGEMLGLLGFNGSGKTTLLKIIAKIYAPDSGEVLTSGRITPFLELGTGFNGELTARDNIIIYGVILGFSKKEISQKIEEIARFAEVERFIDTKLKNFSAGMNARLAFSTALQVNPDIMLVDEVLSVGDINFQQKSFEAFMDFKRKGKTIVFVSHSPEQIEKLCDRAIWIHEGKIQSQGNPSEVIKEYKKHAGQ